MNVGLVVMLGAVGVSIGLLLVASLAFRAFDTPLALIGARRRSRSTA